VRKDGQIVSLDYQMQFFFDAQGKVHAHRPVRRTSSRTHDLTRDHGWLCDVCR
jgi:hypothetical protein